MTIEWTKYKADSGNLGLESCGSLSENDRKR